jgi:uncharacterized protein
MQHISPTPLLMVIAEHDVTAPGDLALRAYNKALEPKQLVILPGAHFDGFVEPNLSKNLVEQTAFLRKTLCS